jgi:Domain of unknown function (DUF4145)
MATFIVDCPHCRAKVGAEEKGRAERSGFDNEAGEPWGERIHLGSCPKCKTLLVGESKQLRFERYDSDEDVWSDIVRVYRKPSKVFASYRIPNTLVDSLAEADRSMQAGANIAACVMLGRALEALCRDVLDKSDDPTLESDKPKRRLMLGAGIRELKEKKVIDDRLFDWSQDLNAFRNLAAHPEDISITRQDVEDLQAFAYAITEYVYDLADRYEEFKGRAAKQAKRRSK